MYQVSATPHFERSLERFLRRHPELAGSLSRLLSDLEADPFHARLRLHPLRGELQGFHAASLTRRYRVVLRVNGKEVLLRAIGTHDQVYR